MPGRKLFSGRRDVHYGRILQRLVLSRPHPFQLGTIRIGQKKPNATNERPKLLPRARKMFSSVKIDFRQAHRCSDVALPCSIPQDPFGILKHPSARCCSNSAHPSSSVAPGMAWSWASLKCRSASWRSRSTPVPSNNARPSPRCPRGSSPSKIALR